MTNKTTMAMIAAIVIVSTTIFSGVQGHGNDAYAQQVPYYYQAPVNTISVTGSATESVIPDLVEIQLGVDTQAMDAQDAMNQNAQAMNATAMAIQNLGITTSEIGTTNLTIQPIYNNTGPYPPDNEYKSVFAGYKVSNTLLIKTSKLGLAGKVLDAAVTAGANRVDSVAFTLSPAKQQSIQNSLINNAILDAQSKAQLALEPLGQKITGVRSVNLSQIPMPQPMYSESGIRAPVMAVQTPVFASNQDITTTVDVVFLIGAQ